MPTWTREGECLCHWEAQRAGEPLFLGVSWEGSTEAGGVGCTEERGVSMSLRLRHPPSLALPQRGYRFRGLWTRAECRPWQMLGLPGRPKHLSPTRVKSALVCLCLSLLPLFLDNAS